MNFYNLNLDVVYNYSTFTSIYFNPLSASNNSIGIIGRCSNATNNDSINLAIQLQLWFIWILKKDFALIKSSL